MKLVYAIAFIIIFALLTITQLQVSALRSDQAEVIEILKTHNKIFSDYNKAIKGLSDAQDSTTKSIKILAGIK